MAAHPHRSSLAQDVRLRGAMLLPLCALAVHQLRFYVAFGRDAPMWLARDGHAYLSTVEPIVLLIAALAVGGLVGRLARAWQQGGEPGGVAPRRGRLLRIWALCTVVLFALLLRTGADRGRARHRTPRRSGRNPRARGLARSAERDARRRGTRGDASGRRLSSSPSSPGRAGTRAAVSRRWSSVTLCRIRPTGDFTRAPAWPQGALRRSSSGPRRNAGAARAPDPMTRSE